MFLMWPVIQLFLGSSLSLEAKSSGPIATSLIVHFAPGQSR
jgi:hypothetical protein